MKTIILKGGLGNQIFEYAFNLYLKEQTAQNVTFLRRRRGRLSRVENTELYQVFDVDVKTAPYLRRWEYKIAKFFKRKGIIAKEHNMSLQSSFFEGYWQDLKYYETRPQNWIKFRQFALSLQNQKTIEDMRSSNSVFIHVRRGNYMSKRNYEKFGSVCSKEYYLRAIEYAQANLENPKFFIFSNDIEWIKENLPIRDSVIVSWNQDDDSYLDLYLMTHCKHAIIANSTFSYWGAYLGEKKGCVIYPQKWLEPQYEIPNILLPNWIGL